MPKPKTEKEIDEALEDSFPASDPPSQSQPMKKVGKSVANEEPEDDDED